MFFISQPHVSGPKTEHESFSQVGDLVYAAGESARTQKTPPLSIFLVPASPSVRFELCENFVFFERAVFDKFW